MRVYFEDGYLTTPFDIESPYHRVDAAYGPTACFRDLYWYREHEPEATIYTNFVNALSFDFSWDMVKNECAAYIRNSNGEWTNIQDMTARELRFGHNIPKLYIAGEFKEMPYQHLTTSFGFGNI